MPLWEIVTGNPVLQGTLTWADKRGEIPPPTLIVGSGAGMVAIGNHTHGAGGYTSAGGGGAAGLSIPKLYGFGAAI